MNHFAIEEQRMKPSREVKGGRAMAKMVGEGGSGGGDDDSSGGGKLHQKPN